MDAAYNEDNAYAACVVVDRSGHVVSEGSAEAKVSFPYIPRYFYYREGPALLAATRGIDFDILLVNAQGIAHPRRLGLASQLGLELDKPTIRVSTSLLVGEIKGGKDGKKEIFLGDSRVGVRLDGEPPLIISVGHMISMETSIKVVKIYWNGVGLLRPLALAHEAANRLRRSRRY